jgi:hypothetical protein
MRINRETLLKLARETVNQRTRKDRTILAVYLCGALLEEDYLLGGTGDIDLIFMHIDRIEPEREIVRLTDEVHLDIAHHAQKDYLQTRRLRMHPWLGPTIYHCQALYDPQHIMDFTQASVRGQFDRPEFVLGRANTLEQHARQMWAGLSQAPEQYGINEIKIFLRAIEHAVNSIAVMSGPPLTERRMLMNFQDRADALGHPGLYAGLMGLLGANEVDGEILRQWMPAWETTITNLSEEKCPPRLHPARRYYYMKAIEALLERNEPRQALWPLLNTWTLAESLEKDSPSEDWQHACEKLGFQGAGFAKKVEALDAYLDLVEETMDEWGRVNGVET